MKYVYIWPARNVLFCASFKRKLTYQEKQMRINFLQKKHKLRMKHNLSANIFIMKKEKKHKRDLTLCF